VVVLLAQVVEEVEQQLVDVLDPQVMEAQEELEQLQQ
jgi:hypothetical protein